jgi:hypothetical protein
MTKVLLFIIFLVAVTPCFGGEIPFTLEKGFIVITAKAEKDVPMQAVVFTGSPYSYFNKDLLKRLKLDLRSTNETLTSLSREEAITFADIRDFIVADEKPVEVRMRPRSLETIIKAVGHNIDAILGIDYLDGRIVQFDFQKHVLRFLDKPPFDYTNTNREGRVALAFRMEEHLRTVFGSSISLPVTESVMLNGQKMRTLFNTAVAYPVSIGPFAKKRFSFGKEAESSGRVQLSSVNLGGYDMTGVPALLRNDWDDDEKRYAAVLGIGLLQNFIVTFDWKNKWIALER